MFVKTDKLLSIHQRNNSESLLHIGLNLVTVVLESGREDLCRFPSLAQLVQDNLSRNLFTVSQMLQVTYIHTYRRDNTIVQAFSHKFSLNTNGFI